MLFAPRYTSSGIKDATPSLSFSASLVTNHGAGGLLAARALSENERKCTGVSNGVDGQGASEWPKVVQGRDAFDEALREWKDDQRRGRDVDDIALAERLFTVLSYVSLFTLHHPN